MASKREKERRREEALCKTDGDKVKLLAGATYWTTYGLSAADNDGVELQPILMTDGPYGVRKQATSFTSQNLVQSDPATCFPCSCCSACTFDPRLMELMGGALGEECRAQKVDVLLGPGVTIKRHPLAGRNFEYFSEDPLLSGKLGAAWVRGVQSRGVGACVKHFAANSQETNRMTADSVVDERALHEIYLRSFEIVVREAQPASLMTAYNRLNGVYCSQNPWLLQGARQRWGFQGAFISDWGAMSQSVPSVAAGLDLCMPGARPDHSAAVLDAVKAGTLAPQPVEDAITRVKALMERAQETRRRPYVCDEVEHLALAQLVAEQGAVLLRNDGALPLQPNARVAVIGAMAKEPRYQGSGSARVNPLVLDCAWDALTEAPLRLAYAPGYEARDGSTTEELLAQAEQAVREAQVAVVFAGLPESFESEGFDRSTMKLPAGMDALISRVAATGVPTVVVLAGGSPMELPWRDEVSAILLMYLPGCLGGHATANLLLGAVNPSGHLAESWPARLEDTALGAAFPSRERQVCYDESVFVGYRYYASAGVPVAYPFGHGLSYTEFALTDLSVVREGAALRLRARLTNAGKRDGAQVVQAYIRSLNPSVPMPALQLAGFEKVMLRPGQSAVVTFELDPRAFAHWDAARDGWRIDAGDYEVAAGFSSEDLRARATVSLRAGEACGDIPVSVPVPLSDAERRNLAPYLDVQPHGFTRDAFLALYGRPLPPLPPKRPFTPDSPISDIKCTPFGSFFAGQVQEHGVPESAMEDPYVRPMMEAMVNDMPLRSLALGQGSYSLVEAVVNALNDHPVAAVHALLSKPKSLLRELEAIPTYEANKDER